jgi:hypothetical protein
MFGVLSITMPYIQYILFSRGYRETGVLFTIWAISGLKRELREITAYAIEAERDSCRISKSQLPVSLVLIEDCFWSMMYTAWLDKYGWRSPRQIYGKRCFFHQS